MMMGGGFDNRRTYLYISKANGQPQAYETCYYSFTGVNTRIYYYAINYNILYQHNIINVRVWKHKN